MALSDLEVFSEYAYSSMTEVLDQQVQLFNAASAGTIVLRSAPIMGDFSSTAMWGLIDGLVRRRNPYASGAQTAKTLNHLVNTVVKVAAGTPPVEVDPTQFRWIQRNPEEGGAVYGQQLAVATLEDMLNTAILSGVAAMTGETDVYRDLSANDTDFQSLLTGASLFGDRSNDLRAWLMHSATMFDIFGVALANTSSLFTFGTVNVRQDGFGRPFVVTDSPNLINATPDPDTYYTLGLTTGAIDVSMNDDFDQNIETTNGDENIGRTIQSEWSYNLGMKGYTWDTASGGKAPTDAALGTAANWDRTATSHKDTMGVLLEVKKN